MTNTGASPYSERPLRVGEVVAAKYRLVSRIGEGGMGEVYEAQHVAMGRRFAVKLLHGDLARHTGALGRFQREAQTAGALESENIVAILDFGFAADGTPFLVMERLVGEDLAHLLAREGPLPVSRAVDVVLQACRGLHAVHTRGIVHRDLKPENLFLCKRGDGTDLVKILDFGIAKLLGGEAAGPATRTGSTIGTPLYMSPEQARGEREIDQRADVYAIGVVLYQCLSGEVPHPGESYNQILYHLLTKPAAPLESLRHGLPTGLAAVVHRAMAQEMNDRFASVSALVEALAPFVGGTAAAIGVQEERPPARDSRPGAPERARQTPMAGTTTLPSDHAGMTGVRATSTPGASPAVDAASLAPRNDEGPRGRRVRTRRALAALAAALGLTAGVVALFPRRPVVATRAEQAAAGLSTPTTLEPTVSSVPAEPDSFESRDSEATPDAKTDDRGPRTEVRGGPRSPAELPPVHPVIKTPPQTLVGADAAPPGGASAIVPTATVPILTPAPDASSPSRKPPIFRKNPYGE